MGVSLMIAVPSYDGTMKTRTWASIGNAVEHSDTYHFGLLDKVVNLPMDRKLVDDARNAIAEAAIDGGFDYLLMVDSDMTIPRDAISNLLEHRADVCMGYYARGTSDDGTTNAIRLGSLGYEESMRGKDLLRMRDAGTNLFRVKGNGLGCAMVNTQVFSRIQRPWFRFVNHDDGSHLSEDYWFAQQCANAGIELYVDTRVCCGHIHDRELVVR